MRIISAIIPNDVWCTSAPGSDGISPPQTDGINLCSHGFATLDCAFPAVWKSWQKEVSQITSTQINK